MHITLATTLFLLKTEQSYSLQSSPYAFVIHKSTRRHLSSICSTERREIFVCFGRPKKKWLKVLNARKGTGLPRSRTLAYLTLSQRLPLFLKRFLSEVFCAGITLTLLQAVLQAKKLLLVCTLNSTFICTNILRYSIISLAVRLVILHSEIIASSPSMSRGENADWFLSGSYFIIPEDTATPVPVRIRQVPGNGSCLFLAIAASLLCYESPTNDVKSHPSMSEVQKLSVKLRNQAVDVLSESIQQNQDLVMQMDESIAASRLVELAAEQHGITSNEYLKNMRNVQVWGGGPEIVALANGLKCNIVLLETVDMDTTKYSDANAIYLRISAKFGPILKHEFKPPIYILSANQNFPRLMGKQVKCNHFLAVLPASL